MIKRIVLLMAVVLVAGLVSANAATWNVDQTHSSVGFKVRHLVVSKTSGVFTDFAGSVEFDGENLAAGSAELTVQVTSVDTDDEKRDNHLRSADFFDVENHPTMSFKSTKVVPGTGSEFQLVGDLTMKGITKEVTFDCDFNGVMDDPWGNKRAGFSAKTKIDRQDFDVSFSKALETGGLVVGNEVEIMLELELVSAK
ncbi:MAG: YceI family protein [bacterium]|nr:YceI family protein [bacterium]